MKMNEFLINKVTDSKETSTLNIQQSAIDEDETIFMNLAIQDGLIEISDQSIVLTAKGSAYLDFLSKHKTNSNGVGLK